MSKNPISPITLSIIWNGFLSIAEEMGTTLQMTAFSEAVREGQDFSTAIFDRQGRLVAQGNFTPGHLGSMPYVIKTVMEAFPPGTLKPGDGVLLNDSRLGSGHYPDFFFVSPVFLGADQIGYLINTAREFFETDTIVLCLVLYGLLGLLADVFVRLLERVLLSWRPTFTGT